MYTFVKIGIVLLLLGFVSCTKVSTDIDSPQVNFAVEHLDEAIEKNNLSIKVELKISEALEEQGFSINTSSNGILILGGDATGLMYGGLELAEMIKLKYDLSALDLEKTPMEKNRGLKFNIPLDARCPSYDDTGDAAQKNIENMWDLTFWEEYFDYMALYRYNVLSLWSPNPFQVMCKLPNYPDLALDDVCVTTAEPVAERSMWDDAGGVNSAVLDHLEVVKRMTIDEKVAFWQQVFTLANDRGVDIYLYTWNIYTNGTYGKYGLTEEIDNPKTLAYYRHAINIFLQTYPQVKGIGVTAGERMEVPKDQNVADIREKWLWEAYGLGIMDYKELNPDREIHFVHRVWYSRFDQIMKYWDAYPDAFDVGYKYVKARLYSSPQESPFIGGLKKELKNSNLKCWWNLRNDDIYVYRWGNPDYVREFLKNLPDGITAGYHMGADGYVFGRVFSDKDPAINGTLEFEKHWMKFMLWGRLGYDNELENDRFYRLLAYRYPQTDANALYSAMINASKVIPLVNQFVFHTGDRHWHPEMCASRESFKFTPYFRIGKPMPGTGIVDPRNYSKYEGEFPKEKTTPYEVSELLKKYCDQAITDLSKVKGEDADLPSLKADIKAQAYLGYYYSHKIMAATLLEDIYNDGSSKNKQKLLKRTMRNATRSWEDYAAVSDSFYHAQMYSRVDSMDWYSLLKDVKKDEELIVNLDTKYSIETLSQRKDTNMKVFYPYKGDRRWVSLQNVEAGLVRVYVFDERKELVNYYEHIYKEGRPYLVWEDLWWLPQGGYIIILENNNKTTSHKFKV